MQPQKTWHSGIAARVERGTTLAGAARAADAATGCARRARHTPQAPPAPEQQLHNIRWQQVGSNCGKSGKCGKGRAAFGGCVLRADVRTGAARARWDLAAGAAYSGGNQAHAQQQVAKQGEVQSRGCHNGLSAEQRGNVAARRRAAHSGRVQAQRVQEERPAGAERRR